MSDKLKYYGGTALIIVLLIVSSLTYVYANQSRPIEVDVTGMSAEQIELLERWME